MPRPLKFTAKQRIERYKFLKDQLDKKLITKDKFNKQVEKLNNQEKRARERKIQREERGRIFRFQSELRKQRKTFLSNVKFNRGQTIERFGHIREVPFTITPKIDLVDKEAIEIAKSNLLDVINKDYRNGNLFITVETESVKDGQSNNYNWALDKKFKAPLDLGKILDTFDRKLNNFIEKGENYESTLYLVSITLKYIDNPTEGGCDVNTHHKRYNDLKIMSPKSNKNNCIFACIHHFLGERILADNTRKALNIELDKPIHISQLEQIAKYYNVKINLFNLDAVKIGEYNITCTKECNLMLFVSINGAGHYVLIEGETKTCKECGKYWVKKHKCNFRRKMFLNRMSGNRSVIPSKVVKDEPFDNNRLIYYDLETFKPEGTDAIIPYAASWFCEGKYYQSYGEDSWNTFIEFLLQQENKIVSAYNGAGFDFHFLMSELLLRGEKVDNVIIANSRIMTFTFGNKLRCWDLCLFTLSSLKDACKSFGVSAENSKTEFDHFKIKSWEDVYTYRSEVEPYIKRDVLGMKEVFEKFSDMLYETFKVWMAEFVTLSSMSYALWTNTVNTIIELPDTEKYEFIRQSLYGGRTYPQQREFTSKDYNKIVNATSTEELKQIYNEIDDWIFNGDATSLYPSVMTFFKYPTGTSSWVSGDIDFSKLGIYEVDIEPNKDLVVPILPSKSDKGGIDWNLKNRRAVYTSADLENALKYGYKITQVHKGLVWESQQDIFSDYILRCYKIKEENDDNPVLRQIGKILMNALYGKMLERARFEETQLCNNINDVWKFQVNFDMTDVQFVKDKVVAIGLPLDEDYKTSRIRKPSQIGTFILSYSRRWMLDIMSSICPKLDTHFFTYTDTDSLHVHASKLPLWKEQGWLEKGLGKVSDDAKGGKIFREINLAPKLYMYLCLMPDGKIKRVMKSKGIPQQYLSPHLFEEADDLDDQEKVIVMENRLKKVGLGKNLQIAFRNYDPFSILSIDMERTFYKNQWTGMQYENNYWFPKK